MHPTAALDRIKTVLNNAPSSLEFDIGVYGQKCYLMSFQVHGLQWIELPKNMAKPNLLRITVEKLQMDFMKKVSQRIYTLCYIVVAVDCFKSWTSD